MEATVNESPQSRREITRMLSCMLEKHIDPKNDTRVYWSKEVTFDYGTSQTVRVDYMWYKPVSNEVSGLEKGDFCCYEIKSSVEDFKSMNGHNMLGDYNYYVMPEDVYKAVCAKIPYRIGVLVPVTMQPSRNDLHRYNLLRVAHKAQRINRTRSCVEMLFMMWRSSRRDEVKRRKAEKRKLCDDEQAVLDDEQAMWDETGCLR